MSTNVVSAKSIQRSWHLIDARGKILGRLAVEISDKLRGKSKSNFVPYLDMGDFVVVTNAKDIKVSGKKAEDKKYYSHSMYPGGLKTKTFGELLESKPEEIIKHAVKGMLPNNKLRKSMLKKLFVFPASTHPYKNRVLASAALKKQLKQEEAVETVKEEETNG
jgi:large subunit ribosomal protein L13